MEVPAQPPDGVPRSKSNEHVLPQSARMFRQMLRRNRGKDLNPKYQRAAPVNVVSELSTGLLTVAMLKMHLDRDEHGEARAPVLLQHLRVSITDTIHLEQSGHTLYRLELAYGSMMHWVIYRETRDFVALHAYFRAEKVMARPFSADQNDALPSFPKGQLSQYLTWRSQDASEKQASMDREYREQLTDYLIKLISFVTFKPQANRLCRFFELSTLALQMAPMAGTLGKQGYLHIHSKSSLKRRFDLMDLREKRRPRWFIVRESFIIIVEQAHSTTIHDVFLMDQHFEVRQKRRLHRSILEHSSKEQVEWTPHQHTGGTVHTYVTRHKFTVRNAERKLKLEARSEREMEQFLLSLKWAAQNNVFGRPNRFDSFAPIRKNVKLQWFVDGRDYYWQVSEAILHARERIYIHDWWLSPEFYFRRPGTLAWRLDHLLKRKAEEGVHIHVILYNEVSNLFTPTDSGYAKSRLMQLHPNIYVQRSPSHLKTGTFYWAHHEKMCVVDEMVGFVGGFDLCFGRWDTPSHALIDDAMMDGQSYDQDDALLGPARDGVEAHVWPGQDYANERVAEWQNLTRPEIDLIPRDKVPRMPWHDVGVQIVGQPARDLCRHFCQRWNMLLRSKKHSRRMSFLLPPPDLTLHQIQNFGIEGTCEAQICRSAGPWSLSTSKTVEHSIQNAYLKAIEQSEHFVYIENQFFVTSTTMEGTEIENRIGLALVERIVRAHSEGTPWRAVIVIPVTPGFPMAYDHPESSSVRIISALEYLSISRGPHSLFGRLERVGINPHEYIGFFALRNWGRMRSGQLVTEQVYPHDKIMIVDDRLAIIGSANINERSMRGDRDSELACVVRDQDQLASTMAGAPYDVGRFPHTLRMRLMREHLGVDVDAVDRALREGRPYEEPSADAWPDQRPRITADSMLDPVTGYDVWAAAASYNTKLYRQVFQCMPDDTVTTWAAYKTATAYSDKLARSTYDATQADVFSTDAVDAMVAQLQTLCGYVIELPLHFLERDAGAGNFMFPMDHIQPIIVFD
ncbi:phospholipase D [Malassezia caprae]|uniref:Phospholipase n=1 Tax=Malassezia caprae TaxID=1381934 RepID=A0AAF0E4G0_9BASI|nr:phospholipase D [Malassezia caprae]